MNIKLKGLFNHQNSVMRISIFQTFHLGLFKCKLIHRAYFGTVWRRKQIQRGNLKHKIKCSPNQYHYWLARKMQSF